MSDLLRELWKALDIPTREWTDVKINSALREIKEMIMASADALVAAFNDATNEVASDLQTLKDQLAAVIADQDVAVQNALNAELAKFDEPLQRLQDLGADPTDPVPGTEVPDQTLPGEEVPPPDVVNPT